MSNNTYTQTTSVLPAADLQVTKSDSPDPVRLGEPLTYTLVAKNNGPNSSSSIVLTDSLPASLAFKSVDFSQGTCSGVSVIVCDIGTLGTSASATVTLVVTPTVGGTVFNSVNVSADAFDPNLGNNTATASTTVLAANLSVTQSDSSDPVYLGQLLTYTLIAANLGPTYATNVMLTDTLPPNVTFTSATAPCVHSGGSVTCNLGTMNNGSNSTLRIVVTPNVTGTITNTVVITGNEPDTDVSNNTATQPTTVLPAADLAITVSDFPDPLKIGGALTYTLVVVNNGPSPATTVLLTDTLPSNMIFGSVTPTQGSCDGTTSIACSLGTLNSGFSAVVTLVITPTTLGTLIDLAGVTGNEADLNMVNNADIETTSVRTYVYLPVILK